MRVLGNDLTNWLEGRDTSTGRNHLPYHAARTRYPAVLPVPARTERRGARRRAAWLATHPDTPPAPEDRRGFHTSPALGALGLDGGPKRRVLGLRTI